jgi:hypothetical protein
MALNNQLEEEFEPSRPCTVRPRSATPTRTTPDGAVPDIPRTGQAHTDVLMPIGHVMTLPGLPPRARHSSWGRSHLP